MSSQRHATCPEPLIYTTLVIAPCQPRTARRVARAARFLLPALAAAAFVAPALASPVLGNSGAADGPETVQVAGTVAPVSALSLDPTQPASNLTTQFIRTVAPPAADYSEIVRLSPSVLSIAPNGPGLSESADLTIRGFSDGQYNVTFDGIPFGDTDDFTHHSTAYFAPQALGAVSVDRGPGTGATIGDATFGGTVSLRSIDPSAAPGIAVSGTVGSFDSHQAGVRLESGAVPALNDAALVFEADRLTSNGYLTGSGGTRTNLFAKLVQPLGPDTTLTAAGSTEWLQQNQPAGATRAEIATYGPDYALSDSPAQQNDAAYNGESYRTDFAYLALHHDGSDRVSLDERVYTYGLYRHFSNGLDVNGETPDGTALGAGDVPGQMARNDLRAFGDVLRAERAWGPVTLRLGIWGEHQTNDRSQYEVDLSRGGAPNPVLPPVAGVPGSAAIDRVQSDTLDTIQPYAELEWRPLAELTIQPGLRWNYAVRTVDSPVMEGTRIPTDEHAEYDALLPSVVVRQHLSPAWTVYGQAAEGFLAPQLQLLDTTTGAGTVPPERTWNFQVGSNWQRPGLSLGVDGYVIQFDNLSGTRTVGGETSVFDEGGATYQGLETEATIGVGYGFSLYGNASLNRARDHRSGAPVPNAPDATLAGGLLYRSGGWFGALTDKWVGARYGDTDRQAGLDPFNQLDASIGRVLKPGYGLPGVRLQLQAQNLLDSHEIDALAGYTVAQNTPLWFVQAGRSVWMTAAVDF
ncbi:TonB-dependent receptor [Lichenicola sp.]|uniref:TonB-dependent receptor n=1 Tax=Lichenicola sp. TaxID=2804529 RepID=UPI003AFF9983